MSRKTKIVTIEAEGRDAGKAFQITEMPAMQLEEWSTRALIAVFGGNVPADVMQISKTSNAAALAVALEGILKGVTWEAVKPLYRELIECVAFIPDRESKTNPQHTIKLTQSNINSFIEEVPTLYKLRLEVLELNLGFFGIAGGLFSRLTSQDTQQA